MKNTDGVVKLEESFAALSKLVIAVVGIMSILVTALVGFGWFDISDQLLKLPSVNPAVFESDLFPLENWLLIAVLVTVAYSGVFYASFMADLAQIYVHSSSHGAQPHEAPTALLFLCFFPIFNVIIVAVPLALVYWYCLDVGRVDFLKYAAAVSLVGFVVNDVLSILFSKKVSGASHLKKEAQNALYRLDLPVLFAFILLSVFTFQTMSSGNLSEHVLSSFGLGGAAFQLFITVIIFTGVSVQNYGAACVRENRVELGGARQ